MKKTPSKAQNVKNGKTYGNDKKNLMKRAIGLKSILFLMAALSVSKWIKRPTWPTQFSNRGHRAMLLLIKGVTHAHLGPIWYHSEPSDIPYSPNQFLALDFFFAAYYCRSL